MSTPSPLERPIPVLSSAFFYRWLVDRDELTWGGDAVSFFGRTMAEVPRSLDEWQSFIHPDDRSIAQQAVARFRKSGARLQIRYRLMNGNEPPQLVLDEATFLEPNVVVGSIRPIETPSAGPQLELVRFFELSLDLFCIANLDGYFLRVNANFSRILGYAEEELVTRPFLDFVHPDDRTATIAEMGKLLSGLPVVRFRNRYIDNRNEYRWFEWMAHSVPSEGVVYAVARDVTEARLAEAQRIARVGSWEWRIASDQRWWSDEYYRILGLRPEEESPTRETFFRRAHPDDRELIQKWTQEVLTSTNPRSFEYRIIRPDGMERILWTEARLERDAEGKPYRLLGTSQDITENRRAQEEKEKLERKLQEAQKLESLGILAGGIAHDFNNLLSAVIGNAGLLGLKLPADSPLRVFHSNILQASERAAALCRQMLAYSGRGRFVLAALDLNRSLRELLGLLNMSIGKKVELQLDLAPSLPLVMADATQIGQVMMNLVINASEAIGDRTGRICVSTGVRSVKPLAQNPADLSHDLPEGDYVVFEVRDTGCGMDDATRRKIFEPFFTTKFTGRGLGLAAVLGIVRGHSGVIQVESEIGVGSTFRMLLPTNSGSTIESGTAEKPGSLRGEGAILVVDDDPLVCETASLMLRSLGFRVTGAADGDEALIRFRESPDSLRLVLLDLTMPKLDGEEVFRTIHALRPQLPVVLMSGFSEQEATARFAGAGLAGFLAKPFRLEELTSAVRVALEPKVREKH